MTGLTLDPLSFASLLAAINLVYVAWLTWFESETFLASRLFGFTALVAAWWALWLGLGFTNLGLEYPQLLQTSQLFSGFFGPLLFLFTLAWVGVLDRWQWKWAWTFVPALAGSLSISLVYLLDPPAYQETALHFVAGTGAYDLASMRDTLPWYPWLQLVHSLQLVAFTFASVPIMLVYRRRMTGRRDRRDALWLAIIYSTSLAGVVLANVMPSLGFSSAWPRVAPLVPLPLILVLWQFVRRRAETAEELKKEREVLAAYLPTTAVDDLLAAGDGALPAQRHQAAVLFSDLRGFTALSEQVSPETLIAWMDRFFSRMNRVVLDHDGMVDKLIGDAVLAVFGAPAELANPCESAVRCALEMQTALTELNREHPIADGVVVHMGIGIHFGELVAGRVGSKARYTYTVFGDTVNAASRIEGLTKRLDEPILVSDSVVQQLSDGLLGVCDSRGEHPIRGRSGAVHVYACTND